MEILAGILSKDETLKHVQIGRVDIDKNPGTILNCYRHFFLPSSCCFFIY
jgi:hypothetical protein